MELALTGEEMREAGFTFVERELYFAAKHPELKHFTPYLRGTYITCQTKILKGRHVELDEAYDHVFVTNGGCGRCKRHFDALAEPLRKKARQTA